jgi:hypothetical protein
MIIGGVAGDTVDGIITCLTVVGAQLAGIGGEVLIISICTIGHTSIGSGIVIVESA